MDVDHDHDQDQDGGDLGSLSMTSSSSNSRDETRRMIRSQKNDETSNNPTQRGTEMGIEKEKEKEKERKEKNRRSKSKEREKEIPMRKQGGSLPVFTTSNPASTPTPPTSTTTPYPTITTTTNTSIKSEPPKPNRTPSSSNSINSTSTSSTNSNSSPSKTNSNSNQTGNRVGNGLHSVKERIGESWYKTVGSRRDSSRGGGSGSEEKRELSVDNSRRNVQGDLSIPFSSLDDSLSRENETGNSNEIRRNSFGSNKTLNESNNRRRISNTSYDYSNNNPSSSSASPSKNQESSKFNRNRSNSNEILGNKFGLGESMNPFSTKNLSNNSSNLSPISPIVTPSKDSENKEESSSATKKKKRRGSKSISSPKDKERNDLFNSEPNSPVPPRRTSLNISRNDYLNMGAGTGKESMEKGLESKEKGKDISGSEVTKGEGLGLINDQDRIDSSIQSTISRPRSKSKSNANINSTSSNSSFSLHSLQRYVLSIGIVNFDLDLGPDLEFLYPPLGISREERDNIAFSSFPDTSIFDDGSCVFSWRVREVPLGNSKEAPPVIGKGKGKERENQSSSLGIDREGEKVRSRERENGNGNGNQGRSGSHDEEKKTHTTGTGSGNGRLSTNYIYGYVFFRQKRDSKIRRGYFQKSLVILSHLPYVSLFEKLVRILGTLFFESTTEKTSLETSEKPQSSQSQGIESKGNEKYKDSNLDILIDFCKNVTNWPEPILGEIIELKLPFLEKHQNQFRNQNSNSNLNSSSINISSLMVSIPNSFSSSQTSFLNDETLLPPSTSAAGRPNSLLISTNKSKNHSKGSSSSGNGYEEEEVKLKKEIGQSKENPLLASIPSRNLFDTFREILPDLWLLWECLLLADPILIMAPDPSRCSEAIWHAIDLIRPIPFAGDFRPFFTMQDHDVSILVNKNKPQSGTLLGVTNPFFKTACDHWSNTLRVGKGGISNEEKEKLELEEREKERNHNHNKGFHFHSHPSNSNHHSGSHSNPSTLGHSSVNPVNNPNSNSNSNSVPTGKVAGGNSAGGGGPGFTPGFTTKRKRRISKDRPLLRRLVEMSEKKENDLAANALLRRYFSSITEMFLAPLNRYVSTLIPADFDLSSPIDEIPRLKAFNTNEFFISLKSHGTPLLLKSRNLPTGNSVRMSLYNDFLNCSNFTIWLTERLNQAKEEQIRRRIKILEDDDVVKFARKNGQLKSKDLFQKIIEEIKRIDIRLNQPLCLGPSSRWRTDHPNSLSHDVENTEELSSSLTTPNNFRNLEKVSSIDSTSQSSNPFEKFVDARSSLSTNNSFNSSDSNSESSTPTRKRSEEIISNPTLQNGTTTSGLISENKGRDFSKSFSSSSSSFSFSNHNHSHSSGQINIKQLKDRKVKLLKQLEKLAETLPEDLRGDFGVRP